MKNVVTWKKDWEIGVPEMDEQHKMLVDVLNNLYSVIDESGVDVVRKRRAVEAMSRYVAFHFVSEEMKLIKSNYPDYAEHKAEHDRFVLKAADFHQKIKEGNVEILREMADFLKLWLVDHINGTDRKYAPYFNLSNNIKPGQHASH